MCDVPREKSQFVLKKYCVVTIASKQTLAMAGLAGNKNIKGLGVYMSSSTQTSLVYEVPNNMIYGVDGKDFLVSDKYDEKEVASVEVFTRTGGAGFPLLCCGFQ